MCAGTPLPRAQRHRDSFPHLCSSLPLIARFPARTCCHMHIATVTHTDWNGGWWRGAGANNLGQTSRGTWPITLRKRHGGRVRHGIIFPKRHGGHVHHGAGGTCAHTKSRQRAPVPKNTLLCKGNSGRQKVSPKHTLKGSSCNDGVSGTTR